jgi:hypothetical protein
MLLSGCVTAVAVPPPSPTSEPSANVCNDINRALPTKVLDAGRRTTDPTSINTAAWGSPPMTLRCGVPQPADLHPTSPLLTVNGVDWFAEQRSAGYVFTTYGRVANAELAVPSAYAPESAALADVAMAISNNNPVTPRR